MIRSFMLLTNGYIPLHGPRLGLRGQGQFQLLKLMVSLLIKTFHIILMDNCQIKLSRKQDSLLRCIKMDLSTYKQILLSIHIYILQWQCYCLNNIKCQQVAYRSHAVPTDNVLRSHGSPLQKGEITKELWVREPQHRLR